MGRSNCRRAPRPRSPGVRVGGDSGRRAAGTCGCSIWRVHEIPLTRAIGSCPYTGVGQHFIQQHLFKGAIRLAGGNKTLLGRMLIALRDNPLNVVSGREMSTGRFYEYHARIHGQETLFGGRSAQGASILKKSPKRPGSWTESWAASQVTPPLQPYGNLGYLWYGSPTELKITAGAGGAAAAYWGLGGSSDVPAPSSDSTGFTWSGPSSAGTSSGSEAGGNSYPPSSSATPMSEDDSTVGPVTIQPDR